MDATNSHLPPSQGLDESIGYRTLRRMASIERYNRWIYDEIAPYVGCRLLEVGCGIGNMTKYFLHLDEVIALDLLPASVRLVTEKYACSPNVRACLGDITSRQVVEQLAHYRFDTVTCLNVLEHIEQHDAALRHMYELLMPGGHLLLLVPAGGYMYGTLDMALGHFRRYEEASLRLLVCNAGYEIVHFEG